MITNFETWKHALFGFGAFCTISSAIYIINDIKDIESDRQHPVKCKRPLAAGAISTFNAVIIAGNLFLLSGILDRGASESWRSFFCILLYAVLNIFYSILGAKHIPLIDIAILASGFMLRVTYGGIICSIVVSDWLYLVVLMVSCYFALGKRRNELKWYGEKKRKVLKKYSIAFLDKNMYMCAGLIVVFYSQWCTLALNSSGTIWTIPIVILMIMRYSMNLEEETDGDPIEILTGDKMLFLIGGIYFIIMVYMIYFYKS